MSDMKSQVYLKSIQQETLDIDQLELVPILVQNQCSEHSEGRQYCRLGIHIL